MSLKFSRQKDRHFFLSLWYKLDKILPLPSRWKLKFYLDMEWIFDRLAHERSFRVFEKHPVRLKTFAFLQSHLSPEHRVLDVGCGNGTLSSQIAACVKHVAAIDHNADLIRWARAHYSNPNLVFEQAGADAFLAHSQHAFDVLVLSHVLEHLEEPEAFLRGYRGHFRFVYVEVPDLERTPLNEYRQQLQAKLVYSDGDHIWEFNREDMTQLLAASGLSIVDSEFRFGVQKYWCATAPANS